MEEKAPVLNLNYQNLLSFDPGEWIRSWILDTITWKDRSMCYLSIHYVSGRFWSWEDGSQGVFGGTMLCFDFLVLLLVVLHKAC